MSVKYPAISGKEIWQYPSRKLTTYWCMCESCSGGWNSKVDPTPEDLEKIRKLTTMTLEVVDVRENVTNVPGRVFWAVDVFIHELGGIETILLDKATYPTLDEATVLKIARANITAMIKRTLNPLIGTRASVDVRVNLSP